MLTIGVTAQEKKNRRYSEQKSVNSSVKKLSKTLEEEQPAEVIADDYINVANELTKTGDYVRAADYLNQAIAIYLRINDKQRLSFVYRELARIQELQGVFSEAILNYSEAAAISDDQTIKELNQNDAKRLQMASDLMVQQDYIQRNINLLDGPEVSKDRSSAYQQMAQVKLEMNDNSGAIEQYEQALELEKDKPEAFRIRQQIANTLIANAQYDEAVALNESLLKEAQQIRQPELVVSQMQHLGNAYFESNKPEQGFQSLEEAYRLAVKEGQTLTAKNVLEQLVIHYQQQHRTKQIVTLYADFIGRLDTLVRNDSTLVDEQFFIHHEAKIKQLEKERALKDELIARKNKSNNILLFAIICVVVGAGCIALILRSSLKKNDKIALQSLRREMNPHFIFNSLNSVNQFIAQNNELEANKYLSSYSKLMRTVMEHSNKDFIPLSTEIGQLKEYLQLEHQRFRDQFTYRIEVDETLDTDRLLIPNMLIQPQLENAIWHGLRYKEGVGLLRLSFILEGKWLVVTIEDDGIGLQRSCDLKTTHQKTHRSRGMTNTHERITLLNKLYRLKITMDVIDKTGGESGVKVVLRINN